jgi:hypothetical protein
VNFFVLPFNALHLPCRFSVASYVKARNCREHQFKRLSGPLTYEEAAQLARELRDRALQ